MSDEKMNVKDDINELRKLRDEIKVKVHLAGMDAKRAWNELEPKFTELEKRVASEGNAIKAATTELVRDLGDAFRRFRDRFAA